MQQVFPDAEHRFCVRHLYQNFQEHFKGENLKNQLWMCARSSTVTQWNENMDAMKVLDPAAHAWLDKMAPNTWVRAFFSTFPKCDSLLNNNCEVFNKYILEARELSILSMLERIKSQLMTRFYNKQVEATEKFSGPVCLKIRKKLLKNADYANVCYVLPAGHGIFQVQSKGGDYIVDVLKKKCDCRRWDLTGIPCNHAIACLRHERIPAEDLLPACYSTQTYSSVYGFTIMPCNDKSMWKQTNGPEIQPPIYEKKVGRPPKSRRKQPHEIQTTQGPKLSRHGVVITCSWCGKENHNRAGCSLKKLGIDPTQISATHVEEQPVENDGLLRSSGTNDLNLSLTPFAPSSSSGSSNS